VTFTPLCGFFPLALYTWFFIKTPAPRFADNTGLLHLLVEPLHQALEAFAVVNFDLSHLTSPLPSYSNVILSGKNSPTQT
jgi:hypothetical protein